MVDGVLVCPFFFAFETLKPIRAVDSIGNIVDGKKLRFILYLHGRRRGSMALRLIMSIELIAGLTSACCEMPEIPYRYLYLCDPLCAVVGMFDEDQNVELPKRR